jgi:lipopolysaccharide/colanic/teichoic acid biosynthesis glycosyltransferase
MFTDQTEMLENGAGELAFQLDRAEALIPAQPLGGTLGYLNGGGKRLFDLLLAMLLLIFTGPFLLAAMMLLWASSLGRDPVIYRQVRVGLHGRAFSLLKLRTMGVDAESQGIAMTVHDDPRVTRLGRLLRLSRIDELPQLVNVLRGDMSLIGPRPERPEFVGYFNREIEGYGLRHHVKPGISGLAQVSYGYGEGLEGAAVKLYYDLSYIKGVSLAKDLDILMQTLFVVLTSRGAR